MLQRIGLALLGGAGAGYKINQEKRRLETLELDNNRREFEEILARQSEESPKFTIKFTNSIFFYMNRRMQSEGYTMTDEHLDAFRTEIDRDSGMWYKLFAENEIVVNTPNSDDCTPVFRMGKFFHWSFVEKVKPRFYE
ncbi:hypothetical protein [Aureispira anguillae]|uniref:Uncharacterized protein n=1 Tax=Aureispira anguillae TaxID=2864201 RepID=A0A915YGJ5_9BACT|nr:hypothetical protein [Aureispira anguillae]BDS12749.1 hypothetical protein AsAng_0034740 [Aureispira anguillae]